MKKFTAIAVLLCMLVTLIPAFAFASFAAEAYTPAATLEQELASTSYTKLEGSISNWSGGCGFLDGNINITETDTAKKGTDESQAFVYVNGKLANFNPNHSGSTGSGWFFSVYGASFVKDSTLTLAFVFADKDTYVEASSTAPATMLGYDSATASVIGGRTTVVVEGADIAANYAVGDTVTARVHDEHSTERSFTVTKEEGNVVTFESKDFGTTTHTLLEMAYGTYRAFALTITENVGGGTLAETEAGKFNGYLQLRTGTTNGNDIRFLFTADYDYLNEGYAEGTAIPQTATATITFKNGDATVKTFSNPLSYFTFFEEITANGEYYYAADGEVVFGVIITNVPAFAWSDIVVEITNGDDTLYTGAQEKDVEEQVAMGGYVWLDGETNINASTNKNTGNESSIYLFDKTATKYGCGSNGADQTITWNYAEAKTVSLYAIYTANDSVGGTASNRNPNSWVLYGSNDGTNFVEIDSVTPTTLPGDGGIGSFYKVDEPTAYQYYKITFTTDNDYFQIGEIKLYEKASSVAYSFNDIILGAKDYSCNPEVNSTSEGLAQLFDNNANTKLGYYSNTSSMTVTWSYDEAKTANGYIIRTGGDSTRFNRNPSSWTLYGSSDNSNWSAIDTVEYTYNFSSEYMIYGIDNPTAYKYYKIEFTIGDHQFQLADITLIN